MQAPGQRGEPDRQPGDDDKGQREGAAGEPAAVIGPELGDGGGRCFGAGGQGHRDGEGEHHREQRVALRAGEGGLAAGDYRVGEALGQHRHRGGDEQHGHHGEGEPPAVAEPGQPGDKDEQGEPERDAKRRQGWRIGDQGAHTGRHRDGDGEDKVDDQGADGDEHPSGPKCPGRALR